MRKNNKAAENSSLQIDYQKMLSSAKKLTSPIQTSDEDSNKQPGTLVPSTQ